MDLFFTPFSRGFEGLGLNDQMFCVCCVAIRFSECILYFKLWVMLLRGMDGSEWVVDDGCAMNGAFSLTGEL